MRMSATERTSPPLENQLQSELNLPRVRGCTPDSTGAGQGRFSGCQTSKDNPVWQSQVGAVEEIESVNPELQCPVLAQFRNRKELLHTEVEGGQSGTDANVPAEAADKSSWLKLES